MLNSTRPPVDPSDQMDIRNPCNFQQRCWIQANEFEEAYSCLVAAHRQMKSSNARRAATYLVAATVVNSAFSLELYLKCLYHIETGKRRQTHELYEIFFDLLSQPKQQLIENLYNKQPIPGVSLRKILERSNNAFDDWRYKFEEGEVRDLANNQ